MIFDSCRHLFLYFRLNRGLFFQIWSKQTKVALILFCANGTPFLIRLINLSSCELIYSFKSLAIKYHCFTAQLFLISFPLNRCSCFAVL